MTRQQLIDFIQGNIYPNGRNQITAPMVRDSVLAVVSFMGDAAELNIGSVVQNDPNVVTGGAVYNAINSALSSAIKFQGITTTPLTDGSTTQIIVIDGQLYTAQKGDEVIYGGKEYLWTGSRWQQLGDEESWALKTISITGAGYLVGGGTLEQNRTIDISDTVKGYIEHGESAYNALGNYATITELNAVSERVTTLESRTNWDTYFGVDQDGNIYVKPNGNTPRNFSNAGGVASGGIASGGGGGGLGIDEMWESLANTAYPAYENNKFHQAHLPATGAGLSYTIDSNGLATGIGIASGYKLPTTTEWSSKADASALANYLPLSGGTLTSVHTCCLAINNTADPSNGNYIQFMIGSADVVEVGYWNTLGAYIQNEHGATKHTLNLSDDGVLYFDGNTVLHSGNYTTTLNTKYVTLDTQQTISEIKTFTAGFYVSDGDSWSDVYRYIPFGNSSTPKLIRYVHDSLMYNPATGKLKTAGYVVANGTSSQFLKADGTVDSTAYLPLSGGTLTSEESPLSINATGTRIYQLVKINGVTKGSFGYANGLMYLSSDVGNFARIGIADNGTPQYWSDNSSSNAKTIYHSGNFIAGINYLPMSGGTLNDYENPLGLNGTGTRVYVLLKVAGSNKGAVGYDSGLSFISNDTGNGARIGVNDSGVPQYWSTNSVSYAQTLYHSGNSNLSTVAWACSSLSAYGQSKILDGGSGIKVGISGNSIDGIYSDDTYANLHLNRHSTGNVTLCAGGGYVGVQTVSPEYPFDVAAGSSGFGNANYCDLYFRRAYINWFTATANGGCFGWQVKNNAGTQNLGMVLYEDGSLSIGTWDSGYRLRVNGSIYGSSLTLAGAISGATNIDSLLYFDTTNSRIGIGTSSPSQKLSVSCGTGWAGGFYAGTATAVNIASSANGCIDASASYNSSSYYLMRLSYDTATSGKVALYVRGDGNVGIGTTSPQYKLDVNGNTRISGYTYFPNGVSYGISFSSSHGVALHSDTHTLYIGYGYRDSADGAVQIDTGLAGMTFRVYQTTRMTLGNTGANITGVVEASVGFQSPGYVASGGNVASSDARLKSMVETVTYDKAKEIINSLYPKEWVWNEKHYASGKRGAGLIAQQVEDVLPFAIIEKGGYKYLNYDVLNAYEIALLQGHETRIDRLERENRELRKEIETLRTHINS